MLDVCRCVPSILLDSQVDQLSLKFTLTRHTNAINAVAINSQGSMLLSGGKTVVVWNLVSGEMMQEICVLAAGFISCLAWIKVTDRDDDGFVFGASDSNIHLYEQGKDTPIFSFVSITLAHAGTIESMAWNSDHRHLASVGNGELQVWKACPDESFVALANDLEKLSYMARSIHFCDNGSSVLVSYLESGFIFCYSIEPWNLKWKKQANGRIGNTCLDGQHLFVSNLRDGVDKYVLPQMHCVQSYHHTILVNVLLQISVAREVGRVILGGDNGFARIFDYQTGAFWEKLDHGSGMYGSNLNT
ncbi:WD40 repeat-like protein [Paxillus ammoniavirescens]|nr:WD40 repeat-like protein [Paxillus ammoniavirescens]